MFKWIHSVAWLLVIFLGGVVLSPYIDSYFNRDELPGYGQFNQTQLVGVVDAQPSGNQQVVRTSFADAVQRAELSVVEIYTSEDTPEPLFYNSQTDIYSTPPNKQDNGIGSGVIINEQGYIVTSFHVIDKADNILVGLHSGETVEAEVVGVDPETDLAVLSVESESPLQAITLADSSKLRNGDIVLAIGNPFGVGKTATMGIVSATGRSDLGISVFESFIQTDAAINPGNSGGALINVRGELVGINSAIFSRTGSFQGIGFAAPSNQVRKVTGNLIDAGEVVRGWLGVSIHTVFRKESNQSATEVIGLFPSGPAEEVGLLPGDLLLSINKESIGDASSAQDIISAHQPGEQISIEIQRDNESLSFEATIGQRPRIQQ